MLRLATSLSNDFISGVRRRLDRERGIGWRMLVAMVRAIADFKRLTVALEFRYFDFRRLLLAFYRDPVAHAWNNDFQSTRCEIGEQSL